MKHYNQPETMILQVNAQSMQMQAASSGGPVYVPTATLGTMSNGSVQMGTMSTTESSSY